ncbi:MAG: phosphoribosylformylglycinamidine synthase subunit PurS [Microbacteriaceae bacterium]|nr:phosphoribosylformylglycinamidine synthase subunit PurS [Microbacteriaceae bacterium]
MPKVIVEVMPKDVLLDPAGKATARALQGFGDGEITDVRIGKRFEITVAGDITPAILDHITEIAADVLSNDVIEDVISIRVAD